MSEVDNRAFLQGVFAETAKGNGRPFIDALADDVRWTIIGQTPWSRTYEGKRAVLDELLRPLSEQLGGRNVVSAERLFGTPSSEPSRASASPGPERALTSRSEPTVKDRHPIAYI
ncbi:hypothetical protein Pth03_49720 [Planotetraspora thailandica]|uniref:SnoaL-like domain-containing protein n=1 Tax=Planotetraspora thailandica TaxID=487172 RepID=A0A8J3XZ68_9ACTN|nr:hypothetical protein [Planotetraspora thailandica]GII56583.1 hypothetical protein Pth03_49720 [Planotetraspora thailandica]